MQLAAVFKKYFKQTFLAPVAIKGFFNLRKTFDVRAFV